jgi:hypothetical protein
LRDSCRDRGICRDKENPNVLTFTIDRNNHITALGSTPQAQANPEGEHFSGLQGLGRLAKRWPGPGLVEIWNALPGQKPVKKFTNRRGRCLSRIWAAAQSLTPNSMCTSKLVMIYDRSDTSAIRRDFLSGLPVLPE